MDEKDLPRDLGGTRRRRVYISRECCGWMPKLEGIRVTIFNYMALSMDISPLLYVLASLRVILGHWEWGGGGGGGGGGREHS